MTTARTKKERKRAAPYVPIGTLSGFLDRMRRIATPPEITSKGLKESGISDSDAFPLLSALKFLNLIDEKGTPTPEFRSLQTTGDEFRGNLEKIVRNAYGELFAWIDPAVDDREHIRNFFARSYSPATAEKATALFYDLCSEAGIPLKQEKVKKQADVAKPRRQREAKPAARGQISLEDSQTGKTDDRGEGLRLDIHIESKDFVSMEPEQIQSFFNGLSKIVKREEATEK